MDLHEKALLDVIGQMPPQKRLTIRLSTLTPRLDGLKSKHVIDDILKRLTSIAHLAMEKNVFLYFAAERADHEELTRETFRQLLSHQRLKGQPHFGMTFQAALVNSEKSMTDFFHWAHGKKQPVRLRLVKGAYLDSDVAAAHQRNWDPPVWTSPQETNTHFEKLATLLIGREEINHLSFATHSVQSLSFTLALKEAFKDKDVDHELYYGMMDSLKSVLVARGEGVCTHVFMGNPRDALSRIAKQLLENPSNLSTQHRVHLPPQKKEPLLNFCRPDVQQEFQRHIQTVSQKLGRRYPLLINGKKVSTPNLFRTLNPSSPDEVVAETYKTPWKNIDDAVQTAVKAQRSWNDTPAEKRAQLLSKAGDLLQKKRMELAAWQIVETGKPWREADKDVVLAIGLLKDHIRIITEHAVKENQRAPYGVTQTLAQGRGVVALLGTWTSPLAALTELTSAALITGNAVLMKPSSRAIATAYQLTEILLEAGIPPGLVAFLPGSGPETGKALINHNQIDLIAFTGTRENGLALLQQARSTPQMSLKKVLAFMGGSCAIIVDEDADLEEAIPGVLSSAYEFQGQKYSSCSRVILHKSIYEKFVSRFLETVKKLKTGTPMDPETDVGPLIDMHAYNRMKSLIDYGKREARLLFHGKLPPDKSKAYLIPPLIFTLAPRDSVFTKEEILGPLLTVFRVEDFDNALSLAKGVGPTPVGGVYSRHPSHIRQAKTELPVDHLFINQKITDAPAGLLR
ncbi:MAG: bifunctional proline dehydrogenase/L-glutamate gamma-semialdehyde dehydrogenase, partial [Elusimicrobia bacterium]|nr:bifunctional proline dehydrogenase/L-glutamate gamma-semialdehyde dehydrogenase [Candidatus Obscuribacterium magneticum]